jgi:hypothetical protein
MANLDDVAELPSIEIARQQVQELSEILLVEALERRELPENRSELVAELAPEVTKRSTKRPVSARAFCWVTSRGPLTEKTKPSGAVAPQMRKLFGLCRR